MEALTSEKARELIRSVVEKITETRGPHDTRYPEKLTEIIQIFQGIRDAVIKVKDDGDTAILEVEVDTTLPSHELHLRITKDTRGIIAKILGKGKLETKIFVFTGTGYRTASEDTLDSHRYLGNGNLRESHYSNMSYMNLSGIIREFHELLQKSSHLKMHAIKTVPRQGNF